MPTTLRRRKVLLVELNEITWSIIDPLIAKLPTFGRLRREGVWAAPTAIERPPHLDPWITWVTVHTGVDRTIHGAAVLGQDDATINAKRTWDYAVDGGRSIGVFGSISAHPARPVPGFMVPGPFSPTSDTYPRYIEPALALNRKYTQVHHKNDRGDSPADMLRRGRDLLALGLRPSTCAKIAEQLLRERVAPHTAWKRVALQPLLNYDVFSTLYRRYQPDYATWHTGHAAHYMHHYWRAWDDSAFPNKAPPEEKAKYGGAIEHGYRVADDLLARFMDLIDDDTVLVVASGLGMKPYVADLYPEGKIVVRIKDIQALLRIVSARGVTEVVPTMIPQWNIRIPDGVERARVKARFEHAKAVGAAHADAFAVSETGEILTLTPYGLASRKEGIRYVFPDAPAADPHGYPLEALFAADTPTPKESMHDPAGVLLLWGKGIRPGVEIKHTTALDIAPTLLTLLGLPVPPIMQGRALGEAWGDAPDELRQKNATLQ